MNQADSISGSIRLPCVPPSTCPCTGIAGDVQETIRNINQHGSHRKLNNANTHELEDVLVRAGWSVNVPECASALTSIVGARLDCRPRFVLCFVFRGRDWTGERESRGLCSDLMQWSRWNDWSKHRRAALLQPNHHFRWFIAASRLSEAFILFLFCFVCD